MAWAQGVASSNPAAPTKSFIFSGFIVCRMCGAHMSQVQKTAKVCTENVGLTDRRRENISLSGIGYLQFRLQCVGDLVMRCSLGCGYASSPGVRTCVFQGFA